MRALCNFIPDNTYLPGFYMDVPGVDTTDEQNDAITLPAVDLGTLPASVFQTYPFQVTASLLNPWGGDAYRRSRSCASRSTRRPRRLQADVTVKSGGKVIPFTADANGDLVGIWGPAEGFPVDPGYNVSTTFDVIIADGAPVEDYSVMLELIALAPATEPVVEPAVLADADLDPVVAPATEPVDEPAARPRLGPVDDPAADPATEPVDDPAADPATEPVTSPRQSPPPSPLTSPRPPG